jgi:hypothetical protein
MRALVLAAGVAASLVWAAAATAAPAPVRLCAEDRGWVRPSPDEMARTVWRDNRYGGPDGRPLPQALAYYRTHFLVLATESASIAGHALDMTGLASTHVTGLCGSGPDAELAAGRAVVVWALGYHVAAADVAGGTLTVTIEPNAAPDHGYEVVELARPPGDAWATRFVLADGREIARVASPADLLAEETPMPAGLPKTGGPPAEALPLGSALGVALGIGGWRLRRRR